MARAGILYSHVAAAAAQLAADGKNPTVDTIRTALGNTGSKSTIAPLLKRWKEERPGELVAGAMSLPPALLEAVRALYERMDAHATARIDEAMEVQRKELDAAREAARGLELRLAQSLAENARATAQGEQSEMAIATLRGAHQESALQLAASRSECAGLSARLADRAAEVSAGADQLRQAHAQLEHYQSATAAQRAEKRQAFERRIAQHEQDLTRLRDQVSFLQRADAELNGTLGALGAHNARLDDALKEKQDAIAALQSMRDQLAAEVARLGDAHATVEATLAARSDDLAQVRTAIAVQARELALSEQGRLAAEREVSARTADVMGIARQLASKDTPKS